MGSVLIEEDRCKGCGLCVVACSKKLLVLSDRTSRAGFNPAEMIEDKRAECNGCASCGRMCPDVALTVYR